MGKTKRQKISSLATKMRMLLIKKNGMFERNKRSKINEKKGMPNENVKKPFKNFRRNFDDLPGQTETFRRRGSVLSHSLQNRNRPASIMHLLLHQLV